LEIYTINASGGGKFRLTNNKWIEDSEPDYSPDGKRIAYQGYDEAPASEIYTVKIGGGVRRK